MFVIDSRGQLFGRLNLVDAAAAVLIATVLASAGVGYLIARIRPPFIKAVAPAAVPAGRPAWLRLTGRDFRPFLNAVIARNGGPPSLRAARSVPILIGTPTAAELPLPALQPGTYDIHVYDGEREIASREAAFTIGPAWSEGS